MSILEVEMTPEMQECLREKAKRRGLGETAYVQSVGVRVLLQEETDSERHYSVMDFHGVGRDAWKGVDVQGYIDEMRDEWDNPSAAG